MNNNFFKENNDKMFFKAMFSKNKKIKQFFIGNVNSLLFLIIMLSVLVLFLCTSCEVILKPKPMAYDKNYATYDIDEEIDDIIMNEEIDAEDMSDVKKYVKQINFEKMEITTDMDIDMIWKELVDNTEYIRMPVGYEDDFNLRRYLSVDYVYNVCVKGLLNISWEDECDIVKEFLVKEINKK